MGSRRNTALELLTIGALGIGAVVFLRHFMSNAEKQTRQIAQVAEPAEYTVMYSAMGSEFRYPGPDPSKPQEPFKTLTEARTLAHNFALTAREIEGKAQIVNVRTGEVTSVE